jgi:SAM-dependent methyltransferase
MPGTPASSVESQIDDRPLCPLCGADARVVYTRALQNRTWSLAKCPCGLRFTHPKPTLQDIVGFYNADSYHVELDRGGDQAVFSPKFNWYVDVITRHYQGGRTIDIGCTTGLFPAMLKQHGFDAEGLEVNPRTAELGRKKYGINIRVGTFEEFEAEPLSYDVVTMTDVVEHTINPLNTMRKANTLLRPNGGALITFPDIASLRSRYFYALSWAFRRDWLWHTCHIPLHTWEFTRSVAERCFAEAGFSVARFERTEGPPEQYDSFALRLLAAPSRVLNLRMLSKRFGTGMLFLLRKEREV